MPLHQSSIAALVSGSRRRLVVPPPGGPAWMSGLATFAWFEITGTTLNAAQSGFTSPGGLPRGVVNYSGASIKKSGSEIFLAGGGHADYAGNEVYTLRLANDVPTWVRRRDPTVSVASDVQYYSDGRPSSRHSSTFQAYDDTRDLYFLFGGASVWGSGGAATEKTDAFNPNTNDYVAASTYPDAPSGYIGGNAPYAACKDASGNFWAQRNDNGHLYRWLRSAATWTDYGAYTTYNYTAPLVHDPIRNRLLRIDGAGSCYFDLSGGGAPTETAVTFGGASSAQATKATSPLWCPELGVYLFKRWDSQTIYQIDPTTFAVSTLSVSGTAPPADNLSGTFGRFAYAPDLKLVFYVPNWDTNVWVFRTG